MSFGEKEEGSKPVAPPMTTSVMLSRVRMRDGIKLGQTPSSSQHTLSLQSRTREP